MKKRIILNIILILFISMVLVICNKTTSNASTSDSQILEDGIYAIKTAMNTGYGLDIMGNSENNGGNLELWEYHEGKNQQFKIKYLNNGYYSIEVIHSNKALDVEGAAKKIGTNVEQWDNNGGENQQWLIKATSDGYYCIVSRCNGLYLDVEAAKCSNGTNIEVWESNGGGLNQKFKFEKIKSNDSIIENTKTISNGIYAIQTAMNTNYGLDVTGASENNGTKIELWQYNGTENQKFAVTYLDNGYYSITPLNSGKRLDVEGASKNIGANVDQWDNNGGENQQWLIKQTEDGYYYIISKCNNLYMDVALAKCANASNIDMWASNGGGLNQKFSFKEVSKDENYIQTVEDGVYSIKSSINTNYGLDVTGVSNNNEANIELWQYNGGTNQRYKFTYLNDGYYIITAMNSNKVLTIKNDSNISGANVVQFDLNYGDNQKWAIIKKNDGSYNIISKKGSTLYLNIENSEIKNGANINITTRNYSTAQKFVLKKDSVTLGASKYPSYIEKLNALKTAHPNWNFKFLYTGITFANAVNGEASVPARNLVPTSYAGEWINGYTQYDSGWYAASAKAIAYYMDPRNFLDDVNIFQFLDENGYPSEISVSNIQTEVNNTYLSNYANDIYTACKNQGVNPYYIISRLIQEQGKNGTTIGKGMDGGDGYTYYNPFDIGASGNGYSEIYANALARAKSEGWNTMEKAIEGGITYCKKNWLDNYQNTLYQNRFDIDSTNGTSLYSHQYMQNLMGAYSEARLLKGMYNDTGCVDSTLTFIIPLYENMDSTVSPLPSSEVESYPMDFETTGTGVRLRESPKGNIICELAEKGTKLISAQRGVSSDWQKVITTDGKIGYVSCSYLTSIDTQTNCNHGATVKTNDGKGCNVRVGPSTRTDQLTAISDGASVTVINEGTYNNIDGYNWSRVVLASGAQGFMPSQYLK